MTVPKKIRKSTDDIFLKALTTLLQFRLKAEGRPDELRAMVFRALTEAIEKHQISSSWNPIDVNEMGRILRAWHLDARYLSSKGKPRPLRVEGRAGIRQLVATALPRRSFSRAFATLVENGLLKRQKGGYWVPIGSHARIPKPTAELLSHFGHGIIRLANTVSKNVSCASRDALLFERCSKVDALPKTDRAAFRSFVEEQATAFITTIDDWLEKRASGNRGSSASACTAGVHAFAFIEEPGTRHHRQSKALAGKL
jgi:hypothetical protein